MIKKLLRCTHCNKVIPLFGKFADFREPPSLAGVEWSSEDLIRQRGFFRRHRNHTLEELRVDPGTIVSNRPWHEPSKVSYFEAHNSWRKFLIRRSKDGMGQAAFYELIPGRLHISSISLKIQEKDLRKQIASGNGGVHLNKAKIEKFIKAMKKEVKRLSPKEVRVNQEGETPLLAYGGLKEAHWKKVLGQCQKDFQKSELNEIKRFIRENRNHNDVLALLIKRKVSILSPRRERAE